MTDKQKPSAYMHNLDPKRIVSAETMEEALKDGGAMISSLKHYTIPLWVDEEPDREPICWVRPETTIPELNGFQVCREGEGFPVWSHPNGMYAPVSAEPVAHRLLRRNGEGEWVHDAEHWVNGCPPPELIRDCGQNPELYRIEVAYAASAAAQQDADKVDAEIDRAFNAVRKKLVALPRYSFLADGSGGVRCVKDSTGAWIPFDKAHALFDPVSVDAARKEQE